MITSKEYELLKQYRAKGYRWIARDGDGELYLYRTEPTKLSSCWLSFTIDDGIDYLCDGDVLFQCIKWEDEEPTKVDDLIHDYESHQVITGEKVNKAELVKEIENILDDIGVSDYQLGECDEDTIWTISSITIREILSAIDKHSPDGVKATVPVYKHCFHCGGKLIDGQTI